MEQPILDNLRVHGAAYAHRKVGENLDLTEETPVYEGTFKPGNGWQHVKFDKEVPTRYFCMEALNAYDGKIMRLLPNWNYWERTVSHCHVSIGKWFMPIVKKRKKPTI